MRSMHYLLPLLNPGAMPTMALTDDQIHDLADYFASLRKQK